jgi:hypothetical protein
MLHGGGAETRAMTKDQKIIKTRVGLLELAKQLGNVSQACQIMGYSRDSFTGSRSCTRQAARKRSRRSRARNRS